MEANQGWRLARIKVAANRITNLLTELIEGVRLRMDRLPDGAGSREAVISLFNKKQNFVHDRARRFWREHTLEDGVVLEAKAAATP